MTADSLFVKIREKQSFLCVGLDPDLSLFPSSILDAGDPVFEFNKKIVNATHQYAVAYKPNIAFYEALGAAGWRSLEKTIEYIREKDAGLFLIADAKRGDIGNTSRKYATAFFDNFGFDAVTVAPYMGKDSISPFLASDGKWAILLALTSNPGASDFQMTIDSTSGMYLFEKVIKEASSWGTADNLMFVVGATRTDMLDRVRAIVPDHFLLVPGIGAQGGSLNEVAGHGLNYRCGLIVNSSRAIIHAGKNDDFDLMASRAASMIRDEMSLILRERDLI
jgi:orotidine-5'-phosphate decarboxylase